jgi:hypothetical protein
MVTSSYTDIYTQRFDVKKTGNITFDEFCIMMGPVEGVGFRLVEGVG